MTLSSLLAMMEFQFKMRNMLKTISNKFRQFRERCKYLIAFVLFLWAVEIVDQLFLDQNLDLLGVRPWQWHHWEGIFLMPFLHGGFSHLLGNTVGLVIFGALILEEDFKSLLAASIWAMIGVGLFTMVFGKSGSIHIGASGLVFGWWSFLIARGFYARNFKNVLIATGVIFFFGSLVYGLHPNGQHQGISWEGHLGGAIGGLIAASRMRKR